MKYFLLHLTLLLMMSSSVFGQDMTEKEYQKRITQTTINGVYIPADLAECFEELNKKISREAREKFKAMDEAEASNKLHYSLGRWIWHNWSLYEGSRLSVYLNKVGVNHPEDMSHLIMITYHRYLNKKPLEVKELALMIRTARDKLREKEKQH